MSDALEPRDPLFKVAVLSWTPNPLRAAFFAMHQDYSEEFVADELHQHPFNMTSPWHSEKAAGALVAKRLLAGERGHYGPLEHNCLVLNVGFFPHDVMQQARTHRIGVSFDVQSGRYTGARICRVAADEIDIEQVFYFRPVGNYTDRQGSRYVYSAQERDEDIDECHRQAKIYAAKINAGFSEEHARQGIPYSIRQHFVVSFNLRSLMHFLDMRAKADAQLEIRQLCDLILPHFQRWAPEVAEWYLQHRWGRARLAP